VPTLRIVASLWIVEGRAAAFESFERKAARIMRRHGGRLEHAIRPERAGSPDADLPFEVHVLRFPDRASFDAYRSDPDLLALAPERAAAIARTSVLMGVDGPSYDE
jgi:uncharacterized protein (DUF1330 family)